MDALILETVRKNPGITAAAIVTLLRKNEPAVTKSYVNRALYKAAKAKLCVGQGDPPRWSCGAEGAAMLETKDAPAGAAGLPADFGARQARLRAAHQRCLTALAEFAELAGVSAVAPGALDAAGAVMAAISQATDAVAATNAADNSGSDTE